MDSILDVEMTDMLESGKREDKKEKLRKDWLKASQITTERMRSISQSSDYNDVIIDLDLYRCQQDDSPSNHSSNASSSSNSNNKITNNNMNSNNIDNNNNIKNNNNNINNNNNRNNNKSDKCISSPIKIQPRTITKPSKGSLTPTPMSSLLMSTSLSLHDNRASKVGPEEFIELIRRKQEHAPASFCRPANRRRTVSENQASLKLNFPQSLQLKFISETKHPIKKDLNHHQPITRDVTNSQPIRKDLVNPQPIRKDLVNPQPIRKKTLQHTHSSPMQFCTRSFHPPPSSLPTSDSMSNYPKFNVGSPTSPYSDLLQYGRSPSDHLILWKEANRRNKIIKLSNAEEESIEEEDEGQLDLESITEGILRNHSAYDAMEKHARVIILDLDLKVGSAFDAIAYDCIHAAPLWDSHLKQYVGMLTMTDFIIILQHYIDQPDILSSIREDPVRKWRDYLLRQQLSEAINTMATDGFLDSNEYSNCSRYDSSDGGLTISSQSSLEQLATHLITYKVHRVLVLDPTTQNSLFLASHRKILTYLWKQLPPLSHEKSTSNVFSKSVSELSLGSTANLVSVNIRTPVNEVFSVLLSQRLSAIPVVDDDLKVVDLFRKADVMSLIIDGSFTDLYKSVHEVLSYARNGFEGLYSCKRSDSAYDVISAMVELQLHRVVILDRGGMLEGVITISDVIKLLLKLDAIESESD